VSNEVILESSENLTITFESDDKSFSSEYKREETFDSNVEESEHDIEASFGEVYGENPAGITVDDALSLLSINPVQNRVVTKKINEIDATIGNIDALLGTL
jgi:hypothetical protein